MLPPPQTQTLPPPPRISEFPPGSVPGRALPSAGEGQFHLWRASGGGSLQRAAVVTPAALGNEPRGGRQTAWGDRTWGGGSFSRDKAGKSGNGRAGGFGGQSG